MSLEMTVAIAVAGGVALGLSLVGWASIRRRRRRKLWLRVVSETYRRREYMDRAIRAISGDEPKVDALYMQYLGDLMRSRPLGLGATHFALYRVAPSKTRAAREARSVESGWFHAMIYFIPKQIRYPWLDHLLEDREKMAREGRSKRFIAIATGVQLVSLLAHSAWELLRDVLTPFKR